MFACNCKGIPAGELKKALEEADQPVSASDMHDQLGGDTENCCGGCRSEDSNRVFSELVKEHNQKFNLK